MVLTKCVLESYTKTCYICVILPVFPTDAGQTSACFLFQVLYHWLILMKFCLVNIL